MLFGQRAQPGQGDVVLLSEGNRHLRTAVVHAACTHDEFPASNRWWRRCIVRGLVNATDCAAAAAACPLGSIGTNLKPRFYV